MYIKQAILAGALAFAVTPQVNALSLPEGSCGLSGSCLTFGDFNVYSLAFLNTIAGYDKPSSGEPYYVRSQPGDIKDGVVFGTGGSGQGVNTNFSGMDDAYNTPNALPNQEASFLMGSGAATEPGTATGSAPLIDYNTTWDADISALRGFLATGGGSFTPFFNLNETGGDTGLSGIDLLIWLHMWVDNAAGERKDYYLYGTPKELQGPGATPSPAGPSVANDTDPQWAYVHGTICINKDTHTVLGLGSCASLGNPAGGSDVDQNLGADNAAFAIYNAELDAIIRGTIDSTFTSLHIDWRMMHENNGYEQAFLLDNTTIPTRYVPEPSGLGLISAGLLALGSVRKRQA